MNFAFKWMDFVLKMMNFVREQRSRNQGPSAAVAAVTLPATVDEWLEKLSLSKYTAAIKEEGYESMQFLLDADAADMVPICI